MEGRWDEADILEGCWVIGIWEGNALHFSDNDCITLQSTLMYAIEFGTRLKVT